jgi:SAM-dependent methyltransferase
MRSDFPCPVCGGSRWETVETHSFERAGKELLPEYFRLRWEIFFDLWFAGQESVELRSVVCRQCGLMTYAPRPDTADIDAQYAYLDARQTPIPTMPFETNDAGTLARIRRVHEFIAAHIPHRTLRILDYGGSDGKLLVPFVLDDHDCEVVDYHATPLPGIRRRGSTIDELPAGLRYDLILCSHVLEHLAEPAALLRQLSALLTDGGLLYVEVPDEIWRGIPITYDPVTHVNFFNEQNITLLCRNQGLGLVARRRRIERFGGWRVKVTGLLLKQGAPAADISLEQAREATLKLLRPGPWASLRHLVSIRIPNRFARQRAGIVSLRSIASLK